MIESERNALRRIGWLFPVVGLPLGCLIDGALWAAVTLDRMLLPTTIAGWITIKGLAFGAAVSAIPLLWRAGLAIEHRWGVILRRMGIAPLGAVLLFATAEAGLRSVYGQTLLWQSVRARAGDNYFAREVALFRLDHAMARHPAPGVVVAGSSQMLHALDAPELAARVGTPVYRRAVAGMFPVELCAAAGFLDLGRRNKLLLMLSGFDIGGRDRIYPDAVRPLATPLGVRLLRKSANASFVLSHWRFFTDMHFATLTDWWRSRDFLRLVMERPFGARGNSDGPRNSDAGGEQRAAYMALGSNPELVAYSLRLLDHFFARMAPRFEEIVVVEGQLNPTYPGQEAAALHARARELGLGAELAGRIRYVPLESQRPALEPMDWLDMAHVNESGRRRYTDLFAGVLTARKDS